MDVRPSPTSSAQEKSHVTTNRNVALKWRRRESKFHMIPRVKRQSSIKEAQKTAHFRWTLRIWHSS